MPKKGKSKLDISKLISSLSDLGKWAQKASWSKIAAGLLGIAVMLNGYFSLDSRVSDLEGLDERVRKALNTQKDIEESQEQINDAIKRAVRAGVQEALRRERARNK